MTNSDIDIKLKEAELKKLQAETLKLQAEATSVSNAKKSFSWSETIKTIGAIIIGLGGIVAAITQYEISSLKSQESKIAINEKITLLNTKKQELKDIEEKRNIAINERDEIELSVTKLKEELSNLTSQVNKEAPHLITKPLVYIQFRGSLTRTFINEFREKLKTVGFNPPSAERLSGTYGNLVKYFNPADRTQAMKLARESENYFQNKKCPTSFELIDASSANNTGSPLEIWVHQSCNT